MVSASEAVRAALRAAGVRGEIREFDESTRTAREAAAALGCDVAAIANSLVFMTDDGPLLILTSGAHRVDPDHVAEQQGLSGLRRASTDEVLASTGQVIGAVSPVGHPKPVRTLIDSALRDQPRVFAAAGSHTAVFETSFEELQRISRAAVVEVAVP